MQSTKLKLAKMRIIQIFQLSIFLTFSNMVLAHNGIVNCELEFQITLHTEEVQDSLPDPLEAGWKEGKVCELLKENERFRVLKCTFPPGGGHDKHYHKPHFGYALSGSIFQIEDETGTREVQLKSGSHFSSEGVDWHRVVNVGDSTSVYLIFEPKEN